MLRKLHNKKIQKRIWIVLMVLIIPGFVVWGFSSSVKSTRETDASYGKIFNRNISREDYLSAVRDTETQLQMQLGDQYYQFQKMLDLKGMALQRLIMLAEAGKRRIKVSDSELIDYIQKDPSFYRKGEFDSRLYEQIIRYSLHMQPRAFEEMTRKNLKIRKLVEDVTRGTTVSDQEVRDAYAKENLQMSVSYIAAIPADFAQDLKPSDEQIKDYFDKNAPQFKKPLSFNLEYLTLASEGQIPDLKERLDKKEPIQKIAKDNNLTVKETGLFGETDPIPGLGWSQEISGSLQSLKAGDTLGPIAIEKNYYVFQLKERKEPYLPEFKEVKDDARARFVKDSSRGSAKARIEDCSKKIKELSAANAKDVDFDKIAKDLGLKSAATGLFKFGSYIEGIGASDNFFNTASKLKEGAASETIELPSGFYIIKTKDKPAIDEKKFSESKEKFHKKVLDDKKQALFDAFLKELIKKAQVS